MEKQSNCGYWNELKENQMRVHLGTKDKKFYTAYILECSDSGVVIIDIFKKKIFLAFDNIKFVEPFTDNGKVQSRGRD